MVNEGLIRTAQEEVNRIQAECESLGAFSVTEYQVNQAASKAYAIYKSIEELVGAFPERMVNGVYFCLLYLRVGYGQSTTSYGMPEWLFGICVSAIGFVATLLGLAAVGVNQSGLIAGIVTLMYLTILVGVPPLIPMANAAAQVQQYTTDYAAKRPLLAERQEQYRLARAEHARLCTLLELGRRYKVSKDYLEHLIAQFNDRKTRLLSVDWRSLRGTDFERYLVEVFEVLGFHVQTTKTSGDQGVDLVAVKGETRLAIQAKGYAGSVGNSAVQEAYAGMAYYCCNRCAVITNSVFTSGAADLASRTKCLLIDGSRLPQLIAGQIF